MPRIALNSARKTLMLLTNAWLIRLAMLEDCGALVAMAVLAIARRVVTDAASMLAANTRTCTPDIAAVRMPANAAVTAVLTSPINRPVVADAGCCFALALCAVCLEAVAWNNPADAAEFFIMDCESVAVGVAVAAVRLSLVARIVVAAGGAELLTLERDSLRSVTAAIARSEAATVKVCVTAFFVAESVALNADPTAASVRLISRLADPLAGFAVAVPDLAMADPREPVNSGLDADRDLLVLEPREADRLTVEPA